MYNICASRSCIFIVFQIFKVEHRSREMKQQDFEAFLADGTKLIDKDIVWQKDEDHPPTMQFRVDMASKLRYPNKCERKL